MPLHRAVRNVRRSEMSGAGYERFFFDLLALAFDAFVLLVALGVAFAFVLGAADWLTLGDALAVGLALAVVVFFGVAAALAVVVFLAGVEVRGRAGLGAASSSDWRSMISKKRFFSAMLCSCVAFSSSTRLCISSNSLALRSSSLALNCSSARA